MQNPRPDQAKFDKFAAIFCKIDGELESFCKLNDYRLDKNSNRQPCRVLRKGDNLIFILEVFLVPYWLESEFTENLRYSMACCAYYTPPENPKYIWKLGHTLLENVTFDAIEKNLHDKLLLALDVVSQWTPSLIIQKGERLENLKRKYST